MFRIGRVTPAHLSHVAARAVTAAPTYTEVGATLSGVLPAGYRHEHREVVLGSVESPAFEHGAEGVRQWAAHRGAGLSVAPLDPPAEGATVAVAAPLGPLTAIAVCRIVAVVDETDRYGFAYGTLPGHPEQGEEAFIVERVEGRVLFRVVAFSRPAELLARLGGPVTRVIQQRATRRYLDGLVNFVASTE